MIIYMQLKKKKTSPPQSVSQSSSQSASQSVSKSVRQSVSQSLASWAVSHSANKSVGQPASQSVSQSVSQSLASQAVSASQSPCHVSQPVSHPSSQPVSQSTSQLVSQSGSLILSQSVSDAGCISHDVDCMSDLTHSQFYISLSSMWKSWELWTKFQPQCQQNSNFFMVFQISDFEKFWMRF